MNVYNCYYLREGIPNSIDIVAEDFDAAVAKFKIKTATDKDVYLSAVKTIIVDLDLT